MIKISITKLGLLLIVSLCLPTLIDSKLIEVTIHQIKSNSQYKAELEAIKEELKETKNDKKVGNFKLEKFSMIIKKKINTEDDNRDNMKEILKKLREALFAKFKNNKQKRNAKGINICFYIRIITLILLFFSLNLLLTIQINYTLKSM